MPISKGSIKLCFVHYLLITLLATCSNLLHAIYSLCLPDRVIYSIPTSRGHMISVCHHHSGSGVLVSEVMVIGPPLYSCIFNNSVGAPIRIFVFGSPFIYSMSSVAHGSPNMVVSSINKRKKKEEED